MSERAWSVHLRRVPAAQAKDVLRAAGIDASIAGKNRGWTAIASANGRELDIAAIARACGADVLQVWFDEDSSVVLQFFGPDGWQAELVVELDGSFALGVEDERLIETLTTRKLVSAKTAAQLRARLASADATAWAREHGLETALSLPEVDAAATQPPTAAPSSATPLAVAPTARAWTPEERAIVDLHLHYMTRLFGLNDFTVYNRYKKHLPAERKRDVDALVNLIMTSAPTSDVRAALESILAATWQREDWNAFIRKPDLLKGEFIEAGDLSAWQRRLARPAR